MQTILITGGSKGIGLELTRRYLERGWKVISTGRNPINSFELQQLATKHSDQLSILPLDVSEENSRTEFFDSVLTITNSLDILINNAGIKSGNESTRLVFGELTEEDLTRTLSVNAIAPLLIAQGLSSLLRKGANSLLVNMSSISGSIASKKRIGGWGYSPSKAALNMISKQLSIELEADGVITIAMHPGWVKTPMTAGENAPLDVEESVTGILKVIDNIGKDDNGKYFDWQGNELPW